MIEYSPDFYKQIIFKNETSIDDYKEDIHKCLDENLKAYKLLFPEGSNISYRDKGKIFFGEVFKYKLSTENFFIKLLMKIDDEDEENGFYCLAIHLNAGAFKDINLIEKAISKRV